MSSSACDLTALRERFVLAAPVTLDECREIQGAIRATIPGSLVDVTIRDRGVRVEAIIYGPEPTRVRSIEWMVAPAAAPL